LLGEDLDVLDPVLSCRTRNRDGQRGAIIGHKLPPQRRTRAAYIDRIERHRRCCRCTVVIARVKIVGFTMIDAIAAALAVARHRSVRLIVCGEGFIAGWIGLGLVIDWCRLGTGIKIIEAEELLEASVEGICLVRALGQHGGQTMAESFAVLPANEIDNAKRIQCLRGGDTHIRHTKGAHEAGQSAIHTTLPAGGHAPHERSQLRLDAVDIVLKLEQHIKRVGHPVGV